MSLGAVLNAENAPRRLKALAAVVAMAAAVWVTGVGPARAASKAVAQSGPNNYAGPKCPHPKNAQWNCTKSTNVTQTTSAGQNIIECANACQATQTITGSDPTDSNTATCKQTLRKPGKQTCAIEQTNVAGANQITNQFTAVASASSKTSKQNSLQDIHLAQHNQSGSNTLTVKEQVTQKAKSNATKTLQTQIATVLADIHQDSTTGNQSIDVTQAQILSAVAKAKKITKQLQNSSSSTHDIFVNIFQHTTSGQNTTTVHQAETFDQHSKAKKARQRQGAKPGGEEIEWDIDAIPAFGGHSTATAAQSKKWTQKASAKVGRKRTQVQDDRLKVKTHGLSPNTITIDQNSDLTSNPGATQKCDLEGENVHAKDAGGTANTNCTIDNHKGAPVNASASHPISTDPNNTTGWNDVHTSFAEVKGTVRESATGHAAIPGATVKLGQFIGMHGATATVTTAADGTFDFINVTAAPATHTMFVDAPHFVDHTTVSSEIDPLAKDQVRVIDFELAVDPGGSASTSAQPQPAATLGRRRSTRWR